MPHADSNAGGLSALERALQPKYIPYWIARGASLCMLVICAACLLFSIDIWLAAVSGVYPDITKPVGYVVLTACLAVVYMFNFVYYKETIVGGALFTLAFFLCVYGTLPMAPMAVTACKTLSAVLLGVMAWNAVVTSGLENSAGRASA